PFRIRKAIGSVYPLIEGLHGAPAYPDEAKEVFSILSGVDGDVALQDYQQRLLDLEGFSSHTLDALIRGEQQYPSYDELIDRKSRTPARLAPGQPGRPSALPPIHIHSPKDFGRALRQLTSQYDLSSEVCRFLVREALSRELFAQPDEWKGRVEPDEILLALDRVFEETFLGHQWPQALRGDDEWSQENPHAEEFLWQYLTKAPIHVPADYDRDGVRCMFRLLDAALLCRLRQDPLMVEGLREILYSFWPEVQSRPALDWRSLYRMEKAVNVYGWAAASALAFLQRNEYLPEALRALPEEHLMTGAPVVLGESDPVCLRYLSLPVLSHGRWALQSSVTLENAHPFTDQRGEHMAVLNGQFNAEVEDELRRFLEEVCGLSLRSDNSSEYLPFLWGYYFDRLQSEKRRYDSVRAEVEEGLERYSIGSQSVDYAIFQQVRDKSAAGLDEQAFLQAARQIIREGGQVAAVGMSTHSPRKLYVISHNRPVFVVHRMENDDFMVVSDINAAMGLFPQEMIRQRRLELGKLREQHRKNLEAVRGTGQSKKELENENRAYSRKETELLKDFRVMVYPLEGEEIFARVGCEFEGAELHRRVAITDFEGNAVAEIEPFETVLNPTEIQKDPSGSFYESHLQEVPERLEHILGVYLPEGSEFPEVNLGERFLRRHFGKNLAGLERIVMAGTGSAYNMGLIAKDFFQRLFPDLEISVISPVHTDDLSQLVERHRDLCVLLSWSGTTADMVQLAKELKARRVAMVAITEKQFSDMALAAQKSGGVMPILSGEEVTVTGVKSTLCMLFCVALFALWLAVKKGHDQAARNELNTLPIIPDLIRQVLDDKNLEAFSRALAHKTARSYAALIIDGTPSGGTGREVALKLQDNSWTAIGRSIDYRDVPHTNAFTDNGEILTLIHATHEARLHEAREILAGLSARGVPFGVVTYQNRELSEMESRARCALLPKISDALQPLVDLAFYYRFAFQYGLAHGRRGGDFPRNRAKSVAAGRTRTRRVRTPAGEMLAIRQRGPLRVIQTGTGSSPDSETAWEKAARHQEERRYYGQMKALGRSLGAADPLAEFLAESPRRLGPLRSVLQEEVLDGGNMTLVPLDSIADAAARNFAAQWRRFLGCEMRILSRGEALSAAAVEGPVVILSFRPVGVPEVEGRFTEIPAQCLWVGADLPEDVRPLFDDTLGACILRNKESWAGSDYLYAVLSLLITKVWEKIAPGKAEIIGKQFREGGEIIQTVLEDAALKQEIHAAMEANRGYETAYLIGPYTGMGLDWMRWFDHMGHKILAWETFGMSAHGPLVTVDPRVDDKFIRLTSRAEMVSIFGEQRLREWEKRYLAGGDVDHFLRNPPAGIYSRVQTPFFGEGNWYFPELRDDYDATQDNLIILDATSERYFQQALDELAVYGCRYARLVVISQEVFASGGDKKERTLFQYPVSRLLKLPALEGSKGKMPVPDLH
ncbi:MAG: SIS domain-containing protein, partial [Thermodesulfobacteriota bacterium]